jgi:hypothetical protein
MYTDSERRPDDGSGSSIVKALELTDLDIDQQLLGLPGVSLVVFTSVGCSSCRWVRQQLPGWHLPVDRVCWVDAGHNGGAVERYCRLHEEAEPTPAQHEAMAREWVSRHAVEFSHEAFVQPALD